MRFDPKIYIRGYGAPEHRLLAFWRGFDLTGLPAGLKRSLIFRTEGSPAETFELLSGDIQTNGDLLALSGEDGLLVLNTGAGFRLFGPDVTMIYSIVKPVETGEFFLAGFDASFRRGVRLPADAGALLVDGHHGAFVRSLVLPAGTGQFDLTGIDIDVAIGNILNAEPGAFLLTTQAIRLLRGFRIGAGTGTFSHSGTEIGLRALRQIGAAAATFALTGQPADLSIDTPVGLSGDMDDTGSDAELLSGDQQTGSDLLTILKEGI